jgi:hypothetical protein
MFVEGATVQPCANVHLVIHPPGAQQRERALHFLHSRRTVQATVMLRGCHVLRDCVMRSGFVYSIKLMLGAACIRASKGLEEAQPSELACENLVIL